MISDKKYKAKGIPVTDTLKPSSKTPISINIDPIQLSEKIPHFTTPSYSGNSILSFAKAHLEVNPHIKEKIAKRNEFLNKEKALGKVDTMPAMIEAVSNNIRTYPVIDKLYQSREKDCYHAMTTSKYKDSLFLSTKTHIRDEYAKKALGVFTYYLENQPDAIKEVFQTGWKKLYKQISSNPDYRTKDALQDHNLHKLDYNFADEYGFDVYGALAFFATHPNHLSEPELLEINAMARAKIHHEAITLRENEDRFNKDVNNQFKDIINTIRADIVKENGYLDYTKISQDDASFGYDYNYVFNVCRTMLNNIGLGIRSITDYQLSRKEADDLIGSILFTSKMLDGSYGAKLRNDEALYTSFDNKDYFYLLFLKILAQEYIAAKKAYTDQVFKKTSESYEKDTQEIEVLKKESIATEIKLNAIIKKQDDIINDMAKEKTKMQAEYNKLVKQLEEANVKILKLEHELDEIKDEEENIIEELTERSKKTDYKEEYKDLAERNIIVIGGRETWQNKIKNLFPNWTVFDKMDLNFDSDLLYTRDVVVNTTVLNHAIYYKIINGLPEGKKPITINYNNLEICLNKIREEINKRYGTENKQ